jgi:hypothetical protein
VQLEHENVQRAQHGKRNQGPPQVSSQFTSLLVPMPRFIAVFHFFAFVACWMLLIRSRQFHQRFPPKNLFLHRATQFTWPQSGIACAIESVIAASETIATTMYPSFSIISVLRN